MHLRRASKPLRMFSCRSCKSSPCSNVSLLRVNFSHLLPDYIFNHQPADKTVLPFVLHILFLNIWAREVQRTADE